MQLIESGGATQETKDMLTEYLYQDLDMDEKDKCLFVDIGFAGTMIDPIRSNMKIVEPPKEQTLASMAKYRSAVKKQYKKLVGKNPEPTLSINEMREKIRKDSFTLNFLVSHTPKASGFMGNMDVPLESVTFAGQNRAVHFLEDTHQSVYDSAKKLVRRSDGTVNANVFADPENPLTSKESNPEEYLIKQAATFAINDYVDGNRSTDAYAEIQEKEIASFFNELIKYDINLDDLDKSEDLLLTKMKAFIGDKGLDKTTTSELKACCYVLIEHSKNIAQKVGIEHDDMKLITRFVEIIVKEINQREKTTYLPYAMATEQTRVIFNDFLKTLYDGNRYLYLKHK